MEGDREADSTKRDQELEEEGSQLLLQEQRIALWCVYVAKRHFGGVFCCSGRTIGSQLTAWGH